MRADVFGSALYGLVAVLIGFPVSASAVETCNGKTATIVGTPGDDLLIGTKYPDVIAGLGGNDTIYGLSGNDTICGGPGNDTIYGGNGLDYLYGGVGDDTLLGQFGVDVLAGGVGTDILAGGIGADTCDGGIGQDAAPGCEAKSNVNLLVKKVELPVWNGSFSPAAGPFTGQAITSLQGALLVPDGATRKVALLATHGAFGGYNRSLVGWIGWWLEKFHMTTLILDRRDSTDYGSDEGGGNTLYTQSVCDLKSGVDYLVNTLGYQGVVILGHSKGSVFAPIYPSYFRNCGADVADSVSNNDPRVVAVATVGTVADGREGALVAPLAGPSFGEDFFPGLNCGLTLYGCDLLVAQQQQTAGEKLAT
ncbi:MAG: calcium-binding protein, partial [Gammaproteobacteria bacterium]